MSKVALVLGGRGALGAGVLKSLHRSGWTTVCADPRVDIPLSYETVAVSMDLQKPHLHAEEILRELERNNMNSCRLIFNAAGAWGPGTIQDSDIASLALRMWHVNLESSLCASHLGTKILEPSRGILLLTGAHAALNPAPGMLSYALSKSGVHYLIQNFASEEGEKQFPTGVKIAGILPVTIDTLANRSMMKDANYSEWTPVEDIAERIVQWGEGTTDLRNGGLYSVITKLGQTQFYLNN